MHKSGKGQERGNPREQGTRSVREAEQEGAGSGIGGKRMNKEKWTTLRNILQSKKRKEAGTSLN